MITTKKIIEIARKWHKQARKQRKMILWRKSRENAIKPEGLSVWAKAEKGHFVVYSTDKRRFLVPLLYLNNIIFRELFNLAEEEFGLSSNVPLTLPCDGTLIEYVITLIQRNVAKDLEQAVLISIANHRCQSSFDVHHEPFNNHHLLCSEAY